ncbi:universal stress protein [Parvibaculum sp.]|uniref:universal stress protein n=1 Tax=Parvibaculum sp. TaxID=2024848 RepID=UPI0025E6F7DE|nr:universal stress protein [Parvibaculum sp.]
MAVENAMDDSGAKDRNTGTPPAPGEGQAEKPRIVIGLDTSIVARETLSLAARLAASVDARLSGVFVEDEDLLNLAGLPFAREISFSGQVSPVDTDRMLRAMRAQAESARRVLSRIADEAHVEWSFDVRRGRPLRSLAAAARHEDTLVIRAPGSSPREVGRAVHAATREARADVLLVAKRAGLKGAVPPKSAVQGVKPGRPVVAIDEGSSLGESCTAFAEGLARRLGSTFQRVRARGASAADIAEAAHRAGVGLLVANAGWLGNDEDAARLSMAAGCPVLLLGSERTNVPDLKTDE